MNRVVRFVLVWVMVIAMPVQGMAASLMLFCGPSHERMLQGLVADEPADWHAHADEGSHDHPGAGHAAHHHAAHHHAAQDETVASQPVADADDAGGLFGHHGKVSCSACAACCAALALPASVSLPEAVRGTHPMQTSSSAPAASHLSDGPERPPRAGHA